ncbi:hypothetical protein NBRC103581_02536 [Gluconobacter wancherniae NBRC 103581]|nr:hypothetical protein [Gluconobacter wancherniae]GBD57937.1 hypothetical protein NBRC103581_02536 [Gluconobacter wancherniae NBRC 103581]
MRRMSFILLALPLALTACGASSLFDGPPADMSELPPPGAGSDGGRHHRHHDGNTGYADDAPIPSSRSAEMPESNGRSAAPGTVSIGSGNGMDLTPRASTPDTEVSYGSNTH